MTVAGTILSSESRSRIVELLMVFGRIGLRNVTRIGVETEMPNSLLDGFAACTVGAELSKNEVRNNHRKTTREMRLRTTMAKRRFSGRHSGNLPTPTSVSRQRE